MQSKTINFITHLAPRSNSPNRFNIATEPDHSNNQVIPAPVAFVLISAVTLTYPNSFDDKPSFSFQKL